MRPLQRQHERSLLRKLFDECVRGEGHLVHLTGPTASGKSVLLGDFVSHVADSGARHLSASGSPSERALELGLINQVMDGAGLPPLSPAPERDSGHPPEPLPPRVVLRLEELCLTLRDTAADTPLVLHVDDAHHTDAASAHCLLYVLRRLHRAPVMAVVSGRPFPHSGAAAPLGELAWLPHCTRIRLAPLDRSGVREIVSEYRAEADDQTVTDLVEITGGVPGLVRAVLDDRVDTSAGVSGRDRSTSRVRPGESYRVSFTEYLRRHDPSAVPLAKALAVMGESEPPGHSPLSTLSGLGDAETRDGLRRLRTAGFLDARGFRCPEAQAAVLDLMGPQERARTHLWCARLLHRDDAPVERIAHHLCAAEPEDQPWAVPILGAAAEQAMGRGEVGFAVDCLDTALACCDDEAARPRITLALAAALWRMDPSAATRHLLRLTRGALVERLSACELYALVRGLLWMGHHAEVARVLSALPEPLRDPGVGGTALVVEARVTRAVCESTYPELSHLVPATDGPGPRGGIPAISTEVLRLKGAESLADVLGEGA
uniref:AAA family ATPase n=1 Tax=Nocardiopsis lucentensis TaxID=53441 RepID=UPI00036A72D5